MEKLNKKEFHSSLDLTHDELERYIPELLKGLWELGSVPEYIIELINRNNLAKCRNIIDLGCGKGAVLIKLAKHFDIKATGIDIVPEFIKEAKNYAKEHGVSDRITFKSEDILETLKSVSEQDLVIYGYDSEILRDLDRTLKQLSNCMKADGHIILEYMYAEQLIEGMLSEDEMKKVIDQSGFVILDKIDWNSETLKQTNIKNTEIIKTNVNRLISQYPGKKKIFNEYLQNQIAECEELENEYMCTTLLLRHSNFL